MKKLLTALLALLFALNMGVGLAESEPVVIKMMVPSDPLEFMEQLLEPFHASQDEIRVEVDGTASGWRCV